ncbi:hypothetical protein ABZU32_21170 [Sphaerisporangium sp. NPDC005288]|uniref:hypothetical protein n=1 Tax=Sphaerisporangium sp. NPDC005288 TaxID=3155114 RepID=UPI0033A84BE4
MRAGEAEDAEGERALSPEEMLGIIEDQRAAAARHFAGPLPAFYIMWGLVWLIGYGALFVRYGASGRPQGPLSLGMALTILFGTMILALVITGYAGWRQGSQVRGASQARGAMYGLSWFFGYMLVGALCGHFGGLLPEAERTLLWCCVSMLVVGLLFMAGGAVWGVRQMFAVGVWVTVVNVAGVVAGPGLHALFSAVGVGGVFIAMGVGIHLRTRLRPGRA